MKRAGIITLLFILHAGTCLSFAQDRSVIDSINVLSKNERKNLERMIDYEIEFFNRIFPDNPSLRLAADIIVFNKYAEYLEYQYKIGKAIRIRSAGFYSYDPPQIVICKDQFEKTFLNTCYHELSHFFLAERSFFVPIWLNEGIATYMGEIKISSKEIKHEIREYYVSRVKTMIELKDVDLKEFVGWTGIEFAEVSFSHDGYGYAIAHCMIHLMMENKEMAFNIMSAICNDRTPTIEAFDMHYAGGFDQFEKDFLSRYSA